MPKTGSDFDFQRKHIYDELIKIRYLLIVPK